ncbi:iron complex outermembrane recepter protein [Hyphomicrobium nitrativorans NL23]|uniref:Iron complex outermembrane recepter protein n=1 Tax=Hyphomicrobium nitrativorans NL23 TaxID=1029756 RepID=V5SD69_9HYPH|nr:TonB-dependent receptor [Hyphomicrobium nitrativorans]AHB48478.1 iron complex outermembrane recepter protein [Hyphomicrobium nitrativorans NL23]
MLCSLNSARTKAYLLSSVAILSVSTLSAAVAQEALPEIVVEQPSVAQGAAFAGNDIDGEGERGGAVLPPVPSVATTGLAVPLSTTQIDSAEIQSRLPQSSDTAEMLRSAPGVSIFQAGGVSGMPAINGLNGDRVKVLLNGMVVSSACANQMNPPLSYADPSQIAYVEVLSGVTPVSKGGDSLGGTVIVESHPPHFADAGEGVHTSGSISAFYRSNGNGVGTAATAHAASNNVSVNYSGAWTRSDNYEDGRGRDVLSSEYESQNHSVQVAVRNGGDLFIVQGGVQYIPYQGYVNQAMDMVENKGWFLNSRYVADLGWGKVDARAFYQNTRHEMNFLKDKLPGDMPMLTEGQDAGYSLKAEIPLSERDLLRIGNEFHHQTLDDWWPPVAGSMMMGPDTYWNINDGTRSRLGTFIEWERQWDAAWSTLLGVRNDMVWTDAGDVAPYSTAPCMMMMGMMCMMPNPDAGAATAFNARDRSRTDTNFDMTALARYEPSASEAYEFGYARKTRSPNLYERYTWGHGSMAMRMIGWFGDLNGYVGDPDLDPEVAHTVSVTAGWSGGARKDWELKVTPYYTFVEDYIGVRLLRSAGDTRFLQFANHDAELYGVNVSGSLLLAESGAFGRFALTGSAGYVHGENADTGVSLYHMMPLNGTLALTHQWGGWTNAIEIYGVAGKRNVDTVRNEMKTSGYALVNLSTSYEWERFRLDLGVRNVLDTYYEDPLGGHYSHAVPRDNVPGLGRSFNAGLTMKF